jgi:hypothetical protein
MAQTKPRGIRLPADDGYTGTVTTERTNDKRGIGAKWDVTLTGAPEVNDGAPTKVAELQAEARSRFMIKHLDQTGGHKFRFGQFGWLEDHAVDAATFAIHQAREDAVAAQAAVVIAATEERGDLTTLRRIIGQLRDAGLPRRELDVLVDGIYAPTPKETPDGN